MRMAHIPLTTSSANKDTEQQELSLCSGNAQWVLTPVEGGLTVSHTTEYILVTLILPPSSNELKTYLHRNLHTGVYLHFSKYESNQDVFR